MRKIRFMAEEFFRNFQKSLFKNILLMAVFSISLIMAVIMCSYYLDMGDRYEESVQHIEDDRWYSLNFIMADYECNQLPNTFTTVKGCRNMMDYYEELSSSEEYPFFSLNDAQTVYMRDSDLNDFFGENDYSVFLSEEQKDSVNGNFGDDDEVCLSWCFQGAQVDLGAYRMFGFRTVEGEGFTEENMTIRQASDDIPILLGNDYLGVVEVGSRVDIDYWGHVYPCRVAGILERGLTLPPFGKMKSASLTSMDSKIIFPHGIRVLEDPVNVDEIKRYAYNDYMAVEDATVILPDGKEERDLAEMFRDVGEKHGIPPAQAAGTSVGMNLFRKESAASVRNLMILTIALLCFAFYGLFVTFYDKIQSNSRIYGIYLMNGCSISMILVPCLLEVAAILLPTALVGRMVFTSENFMGFPVDKTLRYVYLFAGAAYIVGAGFLTYLMRGVDTEHLIRQKD